MKSIKEKQLLVKWSRAMNETIEHNHSLQLRGNINGYSEIFLVAVKATTNNDDVLGSITWEEQN
jgi:hypothetical protein